MERSERGSRQLQLKQVTIRNCERSSLRRVSKTDIRSFKINLTFMMQRIEFLAVLEGTSASWRSYSAEWQRLVKILKISSARKKAPRRAGKDKKVGIGETLVAQSLRRSSTRAAEISVNGNDRDQVCVKARKLEIANLLLVIQFL